MTTIYYEPDADLALLRDQTIAVVGYGNQRRCWALNLRDSGCLVRVCVRADATRGQAEADGFAAADLAAASDAPIACILVPDDAIPELPPRMLGPEVRRCYEEGIGFITAVGVHQDVTGTALASRPPSSRPCSRRGSRSKRS
jgi:ketol-acid reductoisomerase